ncbi:MAG: hypothetical protein PF689_01150 [Deltaproteobacteria bacterium]|jgi:hypothetical protein|nr:hypothetical protein [Deltaproteobacteria bacterium]
MKKKLFLTIITMVFAFSACSKSEEKKDENKKDSKKTTEAKDKDKAGKKKEVAKKKEEKKEVKVLKLEKTAELPLLKLKVKLPKGTEVKKSIIAGAHSVSALGSTMAIKKRLLTDKEFEPYIKKIKAGQIIKFKKWIVKKGEKKTYEIMYEATLNGQPKYVYSRMFQIDGKDYSCHTNAKTLAAAKTLQAICNSVSK